MGVLDRAVRFIDDVLLLPEELRVALDEADASVDAGDADAAARRYLEVLAARPQLVRAQVGLARARSRLGDLSGAREAVAWARASAPDDPDVALLAARLALAAGELEEAAVAARDAQRRFPEEDGAALADASVVRAEAEARRGRPDRAARELRKALAAKDDVATRVRLAEVLVLAGRSAQARATATSLAKAELDDAQAARLGLALAHVAPDVAGPWLERGAAKGNAAALVALAARARAGGDLSRAEELARRGVARGGGAEALRALAEVRLAQGAGKEAAEAFGAAAAASSGDVELARAAVRAAPLDDAPSLSAHTTLLEARAPGDPAACAARALAAFALGRTDEANAALADVPGDSREPRVPLARALLALARRDAPATLAALDDFARTPAALRTRADAARADVLRRDALAVAWRGPDGEVDLAGATDAVVRFAASRAPALAEVERRAKAVRDALDAPLSLAILGEFNAGKSTLVNAWVGADVAPTGIVPTTATLNVLRAGAERRVRVVRRDGSTREGDFDDLERLLADAEVDRASATDHVEILLPSEALERVWIVDAPGTNALDEAHEAVAREALERADAIVWVFNAGQAGKESERRTLEAVRASRRLVVPVINKADRLAPGELAQVEALLLRELPALGRAPLAVSAREARRAQAAGDEDALARSGFPALRDAIEREVVARSRELKRASSAHRLVALLDAALAEAPARLGERRAEEDALAALAAPLARLGARLATAVDDALAAHADAEASGLASAAGEVLAFLRPRTSRFARHGVDREDRAFLGEVLDRGRRAALDALVAALSARLDALLAEPAPALAARAVPVERIRAALGVPAATHAAYARGFLAGGALERAVAALTRLDPLSHAAVVEVLAGIAVDPREHLRPGLVEAAADLLQELDALRQAEADRLAAERDALEARTYAPLRALREALSALF